MESQLINFAGVFFGLVPLLIGIYTIKEFKPVYHRFWIFGFVFIGIAAALFTLLDNLTLIALSIIPESAEVEAELAEMKSSLAIWTYIGPAAIAALGVNLITEFITRDKPE